MLRTENEAKGSKLRLGWVLLERKFAAWRRECVLVWFKCAFVMDTSLEFPCSLDKKKKKKNQHFNPHFDSFLITFHVEKCQDSYEPKFFFFLLWHIHPCSFVLLFPISLSLFLKLSPWRGTSIANRQRYQSLTCARGHLHDLAISVNTDKACN